MVSSHGRQVVVGGVMSTTETIVAQCPHGAPRLEWLVKRMENNGLTEGAGDGTRTRDSLLGRQVVP
uniref:Uncharacterized protein n=1 Tax=Thermogemmatispora argillosa TaxID=2045280 RepID=A0A455T3Z6_9CHLR|nr:hypothetical protein KTA_03030 [Thermogemmatispora argillosa]